MAKGQMRGNRETRKPKAEKPAAAPAGTSFLTKAKPGTAAPAKKKP